MVTVVLNGVNLGLTGWTAAIVCYLEAKGGTCSYFDKRNEVVNLVADFTCREIKSSRELQVSDV